MTEQFWAKTGKGAFQEKGSPKYHPVICHLADTAAVAMEIVRSHLSSLAVKHLSQGLGLTGESLIRFCGFMAGCHDLGKVRHPQQSWWLDECDRPKGGWPCLEMSLFI